MDMRSQNSVLREVVAAIGGGDPPVIAVSPLVSSPITIGIRAPVVILPQGLAADLRPSELRDVLIHECAHVVRRDAVISVMQRLAALFYWPHPLVHYLNAQLSRSREEVCDNYVINHVNSCEYARTLLQLTERCRPVKVGCGGIGLMNTRWTLKDRITGLLDPRRDTMIRSDLRARILTALVLVLAVAATAGFQPVKPVEAQALPSSGGAASAPRSLERIVQGLVVDTQGRPVAGAECARSAVRNYAPRSARVWMVGSNFAYRGAC